MGAAMPSKLAISAVVGAAALGLVVTMGVSDASAYAAPAVAASPSALTACPASPPEAPPPPGVVTVAQTIKPVDTTGSIVIHPTGKAQIQCGRTQVATYSDVTYATPTAATGQVDLKMDVQVPQTAGKKPVVVYIPPGGFLSSDKSTSLDQRTYLAEQGYVVASIEYRTEVIGATYRDGVADVKSAVRYLRAHAAQYGIDSSKVAVWGQSRAVTWPR